MIHTIRKLIKPMLCLAVGVSSATAAGNHNAYFYSRDDGTGGLRVALLDDSLRVSKQPLGDYAITSSDFGSWGSHKKMYDPAVTRTGNGYTLCFRVTPGGDTWGHSHSADLIDWTVQEYDHDSIAADYLRMTIEGTPVTGTMVDLDEATLSNMRSCLRVRRQRESLEQERMRDDTWRFPHRDTIKMTLARAGEPYGISDRLIGIFFEDINYAADGGLYAELLQNRDFEYDNSERRHRPEWNSTYAWKMSGGITIDTVAPLHPNNPHYARVRVGGEPQTMENSGYDGIALKRGEKYRVTLRIRNVGRHTKLRVKAVDSNGKELAYARMKTEPREDGWATASATIAPKDDASDASLRVEISGNGTYDIDMVSLMPIDTYKGRENGMRRDLAEALAGLKPRFVRFPGGCVAHGDGIDNIYDWKGSIGPLEARRPLRNLWGYHQSRGLGYMEYFRFCEDIGAEPLPVLAAGVPCQNSSTPSHHTNDLVTACGQQGGIPLGEEMDAYIQDILDLVEWANGDTTTRWGAVRRSLGHPEPFNLKMIGIGNEDLISEAFETRFNMITDTLRKYHPEIAVVGTSGPFYEGADYRRGWEIARRKGIEYVDEHYYVTPGWLIHNRGFYDAYPRGGTRVYLGEYASHNPDRVSNLEAALTIALYLTDVERNGDVVAMTSYAPLLARQGHTQWRPDMIYFTGDSVGLTPDYRVQQMYGNNAGTVYIPMSRTLSDHSDKVACRLGHSVTVDPATCETIVKLANLTPCHAEVTMPYTGDATVTTLQGDPNDTEVTPVTGCIQVQGKMSLAPYSFTVARFPVQE